MFTSVSLSPQQRQKITTTSSSHPILCKSLITDHPLLGHHHPLVTNPPKMKFLALLLLAVSASYAVALPAAEAEPDNTLVARKTCTRRLKYRPDKHGVCVDLAVQFPACTGGQLYKADCGSLGATWYCCIL